MHEPMQILLSTPEVAELAKKDRSTITRWVKSGRLTPVHRTPGGSLLFNRSDVEALLAEVTQ